MRAPEEPSRLPVAREVLRLTWPAVLTSFLQTLVFLVDRLLLGRYSQDALASMQVQGPLLWSTFSVFAGLCVGTVPLVARTIGGRDVERARAVARAALRLALVVGVGVAALGLVVTSPIVALIGPDGAALRSLSERYVSIALLGFPAMFVATTAALVLQASGNTRTPFLAGLVSNLVNVVASTLLIFGADLGRLGRVPELGVSGAAVGSVLAFVLEAGLLLAALRQPSGSLALVPLWTGGDLRRATRDILRISMPAVVERVVIHAGFLAYASVITSLGALVMAANQALITLESICFLSADGFGIAAATVVGQALGKGAPRDARLGGALGAGFAVVALTSLGAIIWATGPFALSAFVPSGGDGSKLVQEAMTAMPWLFLSQPFMATSIVLGQALRGAGDTRSPLLAAVLGGFLLRVGLAYHLGVQLGLGVSAVWMASTFDWMLRTALLGTIYWRGRWTRLQL